MPWASPMPAFQEATAVAVAASNRTTGSMAVPRWKAAIRPSGSVTTADTRPNEAPGGSPSWAQRLLAMYRRPPSPGWSQMLRRSPATALTAPTVRPARGSPELHIGIELQDPLRADDHELPAQRQPRPRRFAGHP